MLFFKKKEKRIRKMLILSEVVLLISSVFIFRSLWTLLDRVDFMYSLSGLWVSLILGTVFTIISLRYIIKSGK